MLEIPSKFFDNDTVHRNISTDKYNGILSCGFLNKRTKTNSETNLVFEYYGALLLLSGEGVHVDCEGQEFKLYPGCFVQRIPGKLHSTFVNPDGKWLEFFICFGKDLFEALSNINVLDCDQDVLYPGINVAIFDSCVKLLSSLKNAPQEQLPLLLVEAQRIILTIYQLHNRNTTKDDSMEIIRQACEIIKQNTSEHLSIQEVAQKLDIGYERFRKLFKKKLGISPGEYSIQERINAAKSVLLVTNNSIKEIALDLGFPDSFSFSKQFKKVVGLSPSEFRSKY